jgi:hypothetical protein
MISLIPKYFKFKRVVNTNLIELIPVDWISDYHLDSYCLEIFNVDKEWIATNWFRYSEYKNKKPTNILKQKYLIYV